MRLSSKFLAVAALTLSSWIPVVSAQVPAGPDFLLRPPDGQLTFRGTFMTATANSDIFAFVKRHHTLSTADFAGLGGELELGISSGARREFFLGAGYAGSHARSEFRDWVGDDDQPIEQRTLFERVPVTLGIRFYVTDRGTQVGSFAWIPSRFAAYVGAGAGAAWYRFRQSGEFIDHESLEVFSHTYESTGMAPLLALVSGLDYSLGPKHSLNSQVKYAWASGSLGPDYIGFNKIDLSGLSLAVGINFRF